nr:unnamed protein product [Spirometra erinaceieuropaei]
MSNRSSELYALEEELKACKRDLEDKEKLILELTSMDVKSLKRSQRKGASTIYTPMSDEAVHLKRDELAGLQAKVGNLCSKTLDQENEIKMLGLKLHNANKEKTRIAEQLEVVRKQDETKSKLLEEKQSLFLTAENEARNFKTRIGQLTDELQATHKQVECQKTRIERLAVEKEEALSTLKTCEEGIQSIAEWMYGLVYSTRKVAFADSVRFSCDDIEELKVKLSTIVSQSRESAAQLDELKDLLAARDKQVAELRRTTNRLTEELQQFKEADREAENAIVALEIAQSREKTTQARVETLESQLQDARLQIIRLEEKAFKEDGRQKKVAMELNTKFKRTIANIFAQGGWTCSTNDDNILETARQLVAKFQLKSENCSRLESRVTTLSGRIEELERCVTESEKRIVKLNHENALQKERLNKTDSHTHACSELTSMNEKFKEYLQRLAHFLSIEPLITSPMELCELQDFLLERLKHVPTTSQQDIDGASRLQQRIQRLQDQLASKDVQLQMWRQKANKSEEEVNSARKSETEALEKQSLAEQRALKAHRSETEVNKLRDEILRLKADLKDSTDMQIRLEKEVMRATAMEDTVQRLEDIRQRQANKIGELVAIVESQQAATARRILQRDESHNALSEEMQENYKLVEELRRENVDLNNFQNVVGRLVGLRAENLTSPSRDIIQRLEKVLRFVSFDEKGRRRPSPSSVHSVRYVSPKGFESARKSRLTYELPTASDTETVIRAKRIHSTELRQSRSNNHLGSTRLDNSPEAKQSAHSAESPCVPSPRDRRKY